MKEKESGLEEEIKIPAGVKGRIDGRTLKIEGKSGSVSREFNNPRVEITVGKEGIKLEAKRDTKREKKIFGSLRSHIKNMIKGAAEGYVYRLRICSSHFPMNVSVSGNTFVVKNFLGEKIPRKLRLKEGVKVKIDGDIITVESPNKELAGQAAGDIEQLTRITDKDKRVFQDGVYIIEKAK